MITELLRSGSSARGQKLCVLGAGNCNDLDLTSVLDVYDQVSLVDLDAESLSHGVARQGVGDNPRLHLVGGIDLSGVFQEMETWSPRTAFGVDDLSALVNGPVRSCPVLLANSFDVVASTCLLSQLIRCVITSLGEAHPNLLAAIQAIRAGHMRLLAHLLKPGGMALLITDIVSSETCPELATVAEHPQPDLISRLIRDRNFFHGLNPGILASPQMLDPGMNRQFQFDSAPAAWVWDFGPRHYLVCAFLYRKNPSGNL